MSDSSRPHGAAHQAALSSTAFWSAQNWWWCYPAISSSAALLSFCLQSFPASGALPMSQLCASGGQSIEASALASVLPVNSQRWFPLGFTGLISLQSKGLSWVFSNTTVWKHQFFGVQPYLLCNSHIYTSFVIRSQYFKNAFRIIIYFALHHFKGSW